MTAPGARSGSAGSLPPVGRLAEEAAQLLDVFAARLALIRATVGDAGVQGVPVVDVSGPVAGHPQCVGWCPVCRSADLLRGERPEVAGKLVDSAIVVVDALRSLLPAAPGTGQTDADATNTDPTNTAPTTTGPTTTDPTSAEQTPTDQTSTDQPASGIERIDIR